MQEPGASRRAESTFTLELAQIRPSTVNRTMRAAQPDSPYALHQVVDMFVGRHRGHGRDAEYGKRG